MVSAGGKRSAVVGRMRVIMCGHTARIPDSRADPRMEKCVAQPQYTTFQTKNGFVGLAWNQQGVCSLRLPASTPESAEAAVLKRLPQARRSAPPPAIARLVSDIQRYFEGEKIDFSSVPVDLGSQEPFFSRVYAE